MKILISRSAKSLGDLYHKTTKSNAVNILKSGRMLLAAGRGVGVESKYQGDAIFFASFTRSRTGKYHYGQDGSKSDQVIFTVDGTAMSSRYKIRSVDYWENSATNTKSEAEERLLSDKRELPILKYIKRMDIIVPALYLSDGTFKGTPEDLKRRGQGLSTLVFLAKKYKIPYAFYQDAKDWSRKRNEFYPTSMSPDKRNKYQDNYDYKALESIFTALTTKVEDINSSTMYNVVEAMKQPSSSYMKFTSNKGTQASAPVRHLVDRISRILKRLGITNEASFVNHIKDKYNQVIKRETQSKYKKQAEAVAKSIIDLMTKPKSELTEEELSWFDTRFDSLLDTKIDYYLGSFVQDYGHTDLTQKAYSLLNMNVIDTDRVLSEIRQRFE